MNQLKRYTMDTKISEEVKKGNFSNFNNLDEDDQIEIMKSWDKDMWIKFRMQNTVSEEDVFEPILKLIDSE